VRIVATWTPTARELAVALLELDEAERAAFYIEIAEVSRTCRAAGRAAPGAYSLTAHEIDVEAEARSASTRSATGGR